MKNQAHTINLQATLVVFAFIDISGGYTEKAQLAPWQVLSIVIVGFVFLYALTLFILTRPQVNVLQEKKTARRKPGKNFDEGKLFSDIVTNNDDGIVIADSEGEIIWMNNGFTRMTGYSLQKWKELRGGSILESSFNIHIMAVMADALRTRQPVTYETPLYTKNAKKLWLRSTVIPVFGEEELKNYIIIDKDITRIKELEEELNKQKETIEFLTKSERAQSVQLE